MKNCDHVTSNQNSSTWNNSRFWAGIEGQKLIFEGHCILYNFAIFFRFLEKMRTALFQELMNMEKRKSRKICYNVFCSQSSHTWYDLQFWACVKGTWSNTEYHGISPSFGRRRQILVIKSTDFCTRWIVGTKTKNWRDDNHVTCS